MKILFLTCFLCLLFSDICFGDIILLKDDTIMDGQLIRVSLTEIMIEVYKEKGTKIYNISLKRIQVERIIDESGIVLFEKNKQVQPDLSIYYRPLCGFIASLRNDPDSQIMDSLYLEYGKRAHGFIKQISVYTIFIEVPTGNGMSKYKKIQIPFDHIWKINGISIREFRDKINATDLKTAAVYPQIAFELGLNVSRTHLNDLKYLFQKFYDTIEASGSNRAGDIKSSYIGIQLSLILKFSRSVGLGATGHGNFASGENHFRIFLSELRYYFNISAVKPWIAFGYSWQSVKQIVDPAIFEGKSQGISLGIGFEIGAETGAGFYAVMRYLPMEKKMVGGNIGEINFATILFSTGLRYNF